ncbi:FAD/NAD(P)-binding domain-containing protein [Aulographum hederae CBS 113979]|uniref:FAD/NAD(P)-binding domain-containing protein n=1 Tax=Aulographum hederae CBS 113979 TaxID=1176131 RepID=A0A6G1HGH2_9PEZI|nr:FAD/NAD(P)-binding domain-containing protein [Aulographum hederae CBS 113979]
MASLPLNIVVVGAGIAGLAAATTLRLNGHSVRVVEKSKLTNEVGAAITLPVNIYGLFEKLGIKLEEHGANTEDFRSFYTLKGDLIQESDFRAYGGAANLIHRVDLHEALKNAALSQGVELTLGSPVQATNPDAGSITLSTGETITADVILGADGVHSTIRKSILPSGPFPAPFVTSMIRMLIPASKLADNPETTRFLDPPGKMTIFISTDGRRIVAYPCRNNTVINAGGLFPRSMAPKENEEVDLSALMGEIFHDYDSSARALVAAAEEPKIWTLYDLPALPSWSAGRAALLGDAAHPLLPFAAQGGAQALEDAATLGVVLGKGVGRDDVEERLKLYFEIRSERAAWVQEFARSAELGKPSVDPKVFFQEVHQHDAGAFAEEKVKEFLERK